MRSLATAVLLCSFHVLIWGQSYTLSTRHYGPEEGLQHRSVKVVFEDKNGFIWLGNPSGLQRFDGHQFRTWSSENSSALIHDITNIGQDDEGWLWLWNAKKSTFIFLHAETNQIQTIKERFGDEFPIHKETPRAARWHQHLPGIPTDQDGRLYFGTTNPASIISYHSNTGFTSIPLPDMEQIEIHHVDEQNRLWANIGGSLLCLNTQGEILQRQPITPGKVVGSFNSWKGETYFVEGDEALSFNNPFPSSLFKIDSSGQKVFLRTQTHSHLSRFLGGYHLDWTPTGWNIYAEDLETKCFFLDNHDYPVQFFDALHNMTIDAHGRIWIYGGWGLNQLEVRNSKFRKILYYDNFADRPFNNSTRGIYVSGDTLWCNFEQSFHASVELSTLDWQSHEVNTPSYAVRPASSNQYLWIGTDSGLKLFDRSKNEFIANYLDADGYSIQLPVWDIYTHVDGTVYIGQENGLMYKGKEDAAIHKLTFEQAPDRPNSVPRSIHQICSTIDGLLWLVAANGLYLYDPTSNKLLQRYAQDELGAAQLPADYFLHLHQDKDGTYWIGTNRGLLRWDGPKERQDLGSSSFSSKLFTREDGLSNNTIYAVYEDVYDNLWLSSDFGIMSFNKTNHNVQSYLPSDGISHQEFNRIAHFQAADSTIYFGSLNGITAFHPDDFREKDPLDDIQLVLTKFELLSDKEGGLVEHTAQLWADPQITFRPTDRLIRLQFALLAFEEVNRVQYAWRVDGIDQDWNFQKENTLQISQLPYGTYTLRIKAQSGTGKWVDQELVYELEVLRPFYLQNWFVAMLITLTVLAVAGVFRWRTRQLHARKQELEREVLSAIQRIAQDKEVIEQQAAELRRLDEAKSHFFINISHELRTPLTLILGPIKDLMQRMKLSSHERSQLESAQAGGQNLLKLVNSIMDLARADAGHLELKEQGVRLESFLLNLTSYFAPFAESKGVDLSLEYLLDPELTVLLDQEKLYTIISNLVSNALKFTARDGKITITASNRDSLLRISVLDTGAGISPEGLPFVFDRFYQVSQSAEGGTGIGLALCKEYANVMLANLTAESTLGVGSEFRLELPLKLAEAKSSAPPVKRGVPFEAATPSPTSNGHASQVDKLTERTILIVEDNLLLQEYLVRILSDHFQTQTVENGQLALDYLQNGGNCDLILTDVMMPEMDGFTLVSLLKEDPQLQYKPVIVLTALADQLAKMEGLRIGIDDYLTKPFSDEELLTRVINLLQNTQLRLDWLKEEHTASEQPPSAQNGEAESTQSWLAKLEQLIQSQIGDYQFSVESLAEQLSMSRTQLFRRLKELTGLSPNQYIREIRLQTARRLLESHSGLSIREVAQQVGISKPSYFSERYHKRFGKRPSEVQ